MKKLINDGIKYLVIAPKEQVVLQEILVKAKEKGVAVILLSCQTDIASKDLFKTTISTDYILEGRICAKIIAEKFKDRECRIVEISGTEGSSIARDRSLGFHEEIEKYDNLTVITSEIGDFNRITAQHAMESIIAGYADDFDAVFAHSDEDGLGVLQALKVAGYKPGEGISIVSINGLQDVIKAIIAGEYTATVENNPRLGFVVFDIIAQIERGFTQCQNVVMPYRIIDSDNAEELLEMSY